MQFDDLSQYEVFQGFLSLIFVIIAIILGIKIILKSLSLKKKEYIPIGLALIFLSSPWWGVCFSFLSIIFFNYAIETVFYMILQNAFIPIALICWIYTYCILISPRFKSVILITYFGICILYEIIFFIFLYISPNLIATQESTFHSRRTLFTLAFVIFAILSTVLTGIFFAMRTFESIDPKIQLKGKFLLIAFISFSIGAFLDAIVPRIPGLLIIVRLILVSSAIEYYLGFFLPTK